MSTQSVKPGLARAFVSRATIHFGLGAVLSIAVCVACILWSPVTKRVSAQGKAMDTQDVSFAEQFTSRTDSALGWSLKYMCGELEFRGNCGSDWVPIDESFTVRAGLPFAMVGTYWPTDPLQWIRMIERYNPSNRRMPKLRGLNNVEGRLYSRHILWAGFAGNAATFGLASFAVAALITKSSRVCLSVTRARRDCCAGCGYQVLDLPICPECGLPGPSHRLVGLSSREPTL